MAGKARLAHLWRRLFDGKADFNDMLLSKKFGPFVGFEVVASDVSFIAGDGKLKFKDFDRGYSSSVHS